MVKRRNSRTQMPSELTGGRKRQNLPYERWEKGIEISGQLSVKTVTIGSERGLDVGLEGVTIEEKWPFTLMGTTRTDER